MEKLRVLINGVVAGDTIKRETLFSTCIVLMVDSLRREECGSATLSHAKNTFLTAEACSRANIPFYRGAAAFAAGKQFSNNRRGHDFSLHTRTYNVAI